MQNLTKSEETKRLKARNLRYKKPIVRNLNLDKIQQDLYDIQEECTSVAWYFNTNDDTLLNALDGNEDEAYEFKMMFADLCAECEQMQTDLADAYVPKCFDDLFVSAGAGEMAGGLLGWDSYEGDYFGLDCPKSWAEDESKKHIMQLTKKELLDAVQACLKILYAYIGLKNRYDSLKAALDILRDQNTGYIQLVKQIEELYEKASDNNLFGSREDLRTFDAMLSNLPQEAWIQ